MKILTYTASGKRVEIIFTEQELHEVSNELGYNRDQLVQHALHMSKLITRGLEMLEQ